MPATAIRFTKGAKSDLARLDMVIEFVRHRREIYK